MRDAEKIERMMATILELYQFSLQDVGMATLTDLENQMFQMTEEQAIDFLKTKLDNPYTELKKALIQKEAEYEKFKAEPIDPEKVRQMFEQLVDQLKLEENTEESDDTEDDSTKH